MNRIPSVSPRHSSTSAITANLTLMSQVTLPVFVLCISGILQNTLLIALLLLLNMVLWGFMDTVVSSCGSSILHCYLNSQQRLSASHILWVPLSQQGFLGGSMVKNLSANTGDLGLIPGQEDPLEKEISTHSSILAWRIPMDRETWWATVHRVAKTWT